MIMKTLCFWNSHKFWGGGEKLHLEYAEGFLHKNYNCLIVADPKAPLKEKAEQLHLKVHPFRIRKFDFLNPVKIFSIIRFFKQNQPEALIFSSSQDMKAAGLAAYLAGVPKIVYLRGLAVPIKNNFINRFYFNNVITHIIANSQETKRTILIHLKDKQIEQKIQIVYHGIENISETHPDQSLLKTEFQNSKKIICGNAGRLTSQKGHRHLLEIAKILKARQLPFCIQIAGAGELEQDLKKRISEMQLEDCVTLLGFVNDMHKFMSELDIFMLSSEWEGFGYVLVEAMMQQKPVIAFDLSSNPEIIRNGETGYLIPFPDYQAFADQLQVLILNPDLRKQMGLAGKKRALENFLLEDSVRNLEKALNLA